MRMLPCQCHAEQANPASSNSVTLLGLYSHRALVRVIIRSLQIDRHGYNEYFMDSNFVCTLNLHSYVQEHQSIMFAVKRVKRIKVRVYSRFMLGSRLTATGRHLSYMESHTVLPASRHKWTRPALTPASKPVLDLPTLEGWKAELA